jgi:hypothetical protein
MDVMQRACSMRAHAEQRESPEHGLCASTGQTQGLSSAMAGALHSIRSSQICELPQLICSHILNMPAITSGVRSA